jgi:hypothetical protein
MTTTGAHDVLALPLSPKAPAGTGRRTGRAPRGERASSAVATCLVRPVRQLTRSTT